ncbi:MAG: histidine kinase dimerization/phosphoacceptor domain -containing protein, partial [Bacteroidia bacterium]
MFCKRFFSFLLILLYATCCFSLFAQTDSLISNPDFIVSKRFLSVENGLASREVFCGVQDKDGFLWFGTRNGLNRFDGKNFKLFTQQNSGLHDNKVVQLAVDDANRLYIEYGLAGYQLATSSTVQVLDLKTKQLKSLKEVFPQMPFKEESVYWISNDGTDELTFLIARPYRVFKYSSSKGFTLKAEMKSWDITSDKTFDFSRFTGPFCIFQHGYAALKFNGKDNLYLTTPYSVHVFRPDNYEAFIFMINENMKMFTLLKPESNKEKYVFGTITETGKTETGIEGKNYSLKNFNIDNWLENGTVGSYSCLLYNQNKGMYLMNGNDIIKLTDAGAIRGFQNIKIYKNFFDRLGNLWICTSLGIFQVKVEKNRFQHYFTRAQQTVETNNQARGIWSDELNYNDTVFNTYANVRVNLFRQNGKTINSTKYNYILYAITKHRDTVYTGANYLCRYDEKKNQLAPITKSETTEIWSLYPISDSILLEGTSVNICRFNLNSETFDTVSYLNSAIPKASFVYRFFKDKNKTVWAVAENGLYQLNAVGDVIDYWGNNAPGKTHRIAVASVYDAYEDKQGIFWIASNGEGLFRFDPNKNADSVLLKQFNITSGMPSDVLYRIEADEKNNLWISTDNGIARFNTSDFSIHTYSAKDGIANNEYNRTSSFKAKSGRIFFGGLDGVDAFYPYDFTGDTVINTTPLQVISYSQYSGSKNKLIDLTNTLNRENKITMEVGDKFFNMEFALLDFQEGRHNYAYKIEGVDKDWNYINENSLRISGLPYGKFTLHIKGQNAEGNWSKNELSFPVEVLVPFYMHVWFIVSVILLIALLIFVFVRLRIRLLQHEKLKLERTVTERTNALQTALGQKEELLKEIHHRVKNNLQVISSLLELQGMRLTDTAAKSAIEEGQSRVQSIAILHHQLYQHEDLSKVELNTFVNELFRQITGVFKKHDQEVHANIQIPETFFDIDTAVPLGLILNELFTNSYKYAHPAIASILPDENEQTTLLIDVNLIKDAGNLILVYKDNGVGLPPAFDFEKAKSLGLRIVTRLAKQIKGT